MKHPILFVIFTLVSIQSSICQTYTWRGTIYASDQREALIGANVFAKSDRLGSVTDLKGEFSLRIEQWPIEIEVSYLGYQSRSIIAGSYSDLPAFIVLEPSASRLTEVVITARSTPTAVTQRKRSVTDFILFDDFLLYVQSRSGRKQSSVVLSTLDGAVLDRQSIARFPLFESLYVSCQGIPYVLSEFAAYQLSVVGDSIQVAFESKRSAFDRYVLPCKAQAGEFLYHGIYTFGQEVVAIHQVDVATGAYQPFVELYDKESLDATVRSMQTMQLYGRFAKHSSNSFFSERLKLESKHLNLFKNKVQYDLFSIGDSILIMDYGQHHIAYYNQDRQHLDDVPIYYNQEKDWVGNVLQDPMTEELYVLIKDKSNLVVLRLDHQKGTLNYIMHTEIDFLDKMQMHGGHLWYTTSRLVGHPGKQLHKWKVN